MNCNLSVSGNIDANSRTHAHIKKTCYTTYMHCYTVAGKRVAKLEICIRQLEKNGAIKDSKRSQLSGLETKLDELRKELSSSHGGIFPHAVLSAQQVNMLSTEKPKSITQARFSHLLQCILSVIWFNYILTRRLYIAVGEANWEGEDREIWY